MRYRILLPLAFASIVLAAHIAGRSGLILGQAGAVEEEVRQRSGSDPAGAPNSSSTQRQANAPKLLFRAEAESELAPHREGNVYAPCVIVEDGLYRMWYGGQGVDGHDRIHYAESRDGIAWQKKGVALDNGDSNHVNDPAVIKVDRTYYLYYTRAVKGIIDRIDVATSADGLTWEDKGVALDVGKPDQWDAVATGRPAVLHEDGVFKMWYDGRKDWPPGIGFAEVPTSPNSSRSVGYATSRDGLRFTRHGNGPVFGNNAGGVDVARINGQLVLAYESRQGVCLARGTDETHWTDGGLHYPISQNPYDAAGLVTPSLSVDPKGKLQRIYVGASAKASWDRNTMVVIDVAPPEASK